MTPVEFSLRYGIILEDINDLILYNKCGLQQADAATREEGSVFISAAGQLHMKLKFIWLKAKKTPDRADAFYGCRHTCTYIDVFLLWYATKRHARRKLESRKRIMPAAADRHARRVIIWRSGTRHADAYRRVPPAHDSRPQFLMKFSFP